MVLETVLASFFLCLGTHALRGRGWFRVLKILFHQAINPFIMNNPELLGVLLASVLLCMAKWYETVQPGSDYYINGKNFLVAFCYGACMFMVLMLLIVIHR
jgi:hypothetical protein